MTDISSAPFDTIPAHHWFCAVEQLTGPTTVPVFSGGVPAISGSQITGDTVDTTVPEAGSSIVRYDGLIHHPRADYTGYPPCPFDNFLLVEI